MELEKDLNKFQKKRIKERLELDFNEQLKNKSTEKSLFSKNLNRHLDLFISQLYENGVLFYALTIKIPFLKRTDPDLWYHTHLQVEKWINEFRDKIELIEFCYISIELYKNDKNYEVNNKNSQIVVYDYDSMEDLPYFKVIIGVRSLIGDNEGHFISMKNFFNLNYYDITIKKLKSEHMIKDYWNFILKQQNFKFHRFCQYSRYFEFLYGGIAELELQYDSDHYAFILDEEINSKNTDIEGIKDQNPDQITILNYLITLYMYIKKIYINENYFYHKIEFSKSSWEVFDCIDYIDRNNVKILSELKLLFPQQLSNIKISKLLNLYWESFYTNVKKRNQYLPSIELNKDIIEFKDGIYIISKNKFCSFKMNLSINSNSFLFSSKKYKNIKKPLKWLKSIEKKFPYSKDFCIRIAECINNKNYNTNDIKVKEKVIYDLIVTKLDTNKDLLLIDYFSDLSQIYNFDLVEIIIFCNRLYFKSKKLKSL